ncbi:UNVERIFIED_CONTAM: hypothetical protein Sindi_0081800 [Sesamum indicum]
MGAKSVLFSTETTMNGTMPAVGRKTDLGVVEDGMDDEVSHDISRKPGDVTTDVIVDVTADSTDVIGDVTLDICKKTTTPSFANRASTGLFIGNIPLH